MSEILEKRADDAGPNMGIIIHFILRLIAELLITNHNEHYKMACCLSCLPRNEIIMGLQAESKQASKNVPFYFTF